MTNITDERLQELMTETRCNVTEPMTMNSRGEQLSILRELQYSRHRMAELERALELACKELTDAKDELKGEADIDPLRDICPAFETESNCVYFGNPRCRDDGGYENHHVIAAKCWKLYFIEQAREGADD